MSIDKYSAGNALIRLGKSLKNDQDTGLDDETLARILELAKFVPNKTATNGPTRWSEEKDPLGGLILEWIRTGQAIPTGVANRNITNALTRLRRNGLIVNRGAGPGHPKWELTTEEERQQIVTEIRYRRDQLTQSK